LDEWFASAEMGQPPQRPIQANVLDASDGLRIAADPTGYSPLVARSPDGKIWFTTDDGLSVVDPGHLPFNQVPPPVRIEQVIADRAPYGDAAAGQIDLPARTRDLQIDYTALSLVAPEKNRFRIKLEGWDRGWQEVGNRRQAFYNNLPPRRYRFRVAA